MRGLSAQLDVKLIKKMDDILLDLLKFDSTPFDTPTSAQPAQPPQVEVAGPADDDKKEDNSA
jgi:hypothetical protein